MICKEIKYYLNDYADGFLINEIREEIRSHLDRCLDCKNYYFDVIAVLKEAGSLPKKKTSLQDFRKLINEKPRGNKNKKTSLKILSINQLDNYLLTGKRTRKFILKKQYKKSGWFFAGAVITAIILGISLGILYHSQPTPASWSVDNLAGLPVIGSEELPGHGKIEPGEWLQTDAVSRARLNIGTFGEVDVQPNSKIKLIEARQNEYRILLKEGRIHAVIWDSPRLFIVETPSATAIDLGCIYTLEVNKDGSGLLKVISGCVALQSVGSKSLIPADAICKTEKGFGAGIPYFNDATDEFKAALNDFDLGKEKNSALSILINKSRKKDALSLWHLLSRVENNEREKTFGRLADLVEIPAGVTSEGIINGNKEMMGVLWESLGYGSSSLAE